MDAGIVDAKIEKLTNELAAVIENSGIHYLGATLALKRLLERYANEGKAFLNTAKITDVLSWENHDILHQEIAPVDTRQTE